MECKLCTRKLLDSANLPHNLKAEACTQQNRSPAKGRPATPTETF